jgi:hypothetical protein
MLRLAGYKTAPAAAGLRRKSPIDRALFCSSAIYRRAGRALQAKFALILLHPTFAAFQPQLDETVRRPVPDKKVQGYALFGNYVCLMVTSALPAWQSA